MIRKLAHKMGNWWYALGIVLMLSVFPIGLYVLNNINN